MATWTIQLGITETDTSAGQKIVMAESFEAAFKIAKDLLLPGQFITGITRKDLLDG
jgi:hypothetical protein